MAFTAVTTTRNQGAAATTGTTPTAAFAGSGPSKDSFLVALVTTYGSSRTVNSITDTQGNVWKSLPSQAITSPAMVQQLWYCERNKAAGANTLTVTLSGAPTASVIQLQEYTTTASKGAVLSHSDVTNGATVVDSRGGVYSTTTSQTSLAVPVQANGTDRNGDLIVAGFGFSATATTTISISAVSGGGSQAVDCQFNGTATYAIQAALAHAVATSAAVPSVTFAFASHRYNGGVIAAFTECTVDGPNLLTPPNDDFEWGAADWGGSSASVAQSSAQARTGTKSIAATATGATAYGIQPLMNTPPYADAPVTTGHRITVMAFARAAATARTVNVTAQFVAAGGGSFTTQARTCGVTKTTDWTSGWILAHFLVPASTATVRLIFATTAGAGSEVTYFDSIMVADGVSCTWQAAPVTISGSTATATGAVPAMRALPIVVGTSTANLLPSVDDGSFEGGTGAWVVGGGTDAISTDYAVDGTHSVKVTGGFVSLHTPTPDASLPQPATAGKDYSFLVSVRPLTINASFQLSIYSYQGATFLESVTSESVTAPTGQFTKLFLAAHAPASTDNVYLVIQRSGASDDFYADCAGLFEGYQPTWYPVVSASTLAGFVSTATGAAPTGVLATTVVGSVATADLAAPTGATESHLPGATATVSVAAPTGKVGVTLVGSVATATEAAPAGALGSTVVGTVGTVAEAAPTGVIGVTLAGAVATVAEAAPTGVVGFSLVGTVATSTEAAPTGVLASSVPGAVATASLAAPVGTILRALVGSVAVATEAAPTGALGVALGGSAATAAIAGPTGKLIATVLGLVATVTETAPTGSYRAALIGSVAASTEAAPTGVIVSTVKGAAATATLDAPTGLPEIAPVVVGSVATASETAPAGTLDTTLKGAVATAALDAPTGTLDITTPELRLVGAVATATEAAPTGSLGVAVSGSPATATEAAPVGSLGTLLQGSVATCSVVAPTGLIGSLLKGSVATATEAAPTGLASTTVIGTVAASSLAAPTGVPSRILIGLVAAAAEAAPTGKLGVTVQGQPATCAVEAPTGGWTSNFQVAGSTATALMAAPTGTMPTYGATAECFVAAPTGSLGITVIGSAATATETAPAGSPSSVVLGAAAGLNAQALVGTLRWVVSVTGSVATVLGSAPAGLADSIIVGNTPGVWIQAPNGSLPSAVLGTPALCFIEAPAGKITTPAGRIAGIVVSPDGTPIDGWVTYALLHQVGNYDRQMVTQFFSDGVLDLELPNGDYEVVVFSDDGSLRLEVEVEEAAVGIGAGVPY